MKEPIFILIHGFGGNIGEVAPLADFLNQKCFPTLCPPLKGHTGLKSDLSKTTYQDWIKSVEEPLVKAKAQYEKVILVGFSMGGLIAVQLALHHQLTALITINTPIYYWDLKRIGLNLLTDLKSGDYRNLRRYLTSSTGLPLSALLNFRTMLNRTKPLFKLITCPINILQGSDDDTVRPESARHIYNQVASPLKRLAFFDHSGHAMLQSAAAGAAMQNIEQFLTDLALGQGTTSNH